MEKIKQFYFIQSKTNPENSKIIAVDDISELKVFKQTNHKVKNIQEYILDYKWFKMIFSLYNQLLKSNDTKQLNNLLSKQKKHINEFLINYIKSIWYQRYIENIPEEYFSKLWIIKKNYFLLMSNHNIPEKDKWVLFKKLENLVKVVNWFSGRLRTEFFTLMIYILAGAWIAYMLWVRVVENLGWYNETIKEEWGNPLVMQWIILYMIIVLILWMLFVLKSKFIWLYQKVFLKVILLREIVQNINALKLINVYLMWQISSVNEVMEIFKSNFPYFEEYNIPYNSLWNINHLIQLIIEREELTEYFDIKTLASLRWLEWKWIDELREKTDELMDALQWELSEQAEDLKAKIKNAGLFLVWWIALLSASTLVTLLMSMTKAIQKLT